MEEIIIVRTDYFDDNLHRYIRRLENETQRTVVLALDPGSSIQNVPDNLPAIPVLTDTLGLLRTADCMWRCGDYCLYAVARKYPNVSYFWVLEPDVRINTHDLNMFFDGNSSNNKSDFITAWFTPASKEWMWHKTIAPFVQQPFNCMLQLSRFSRGAVEYLLDRRRELTHEFSRRGLPFSEWPNDEAFVGAYLNKGSFSISTFSEFASQFNTTDTFTFTKPTSLKWLESRDEDDSLYHPVVSGPRYIARIRSYLGEVSTTGSRAKIMQQFGPEVLHQAYLEGGDHAKWQLYSEIKRALQNSF